MMSTPIPSAFEMSDAAIRGRFSFSLEAGWQTPAHLPAGFGE